MKNVDPGDQQGLEQELVKVFVTIRVSMSIDVGGWR